MSLRLRWITTAIVVVAQFVIAVRGVAALRAQQSRPVVVYAGLTVMRESPRGAWFPVDLAESDVRAGDRIQVNVHSPQTVEVTLLQLGGDDDLPTILYPVPGRYAYNLDPETFYTLPSPSTWYNVDAVAAGDRLVLLAQRPERGRTPLYDMSATELVALRQEGQRTDSVPRARMEVPRPDGGSEQADLVEISATRTAWMQWRLYQ